MTGGIIGIVPIMSSAKGGGPPPIMLIIGGPLGGIMFIEGIMLIGGPGGIIPIVGPGPIRGIEPGMVGYMTKLLTGCLYTRRNCSMETKLQNILATGT